MIAVFALVVSVVSFCLIGIFMPPVGAAQLGLLLATVGLLIGFGYLEVRYQRTKVLSRKVERKKGPTFVAYWPVGFVAATWVWMLDLRLGLFVFAVAAAFAAFSLLVLNARHRAQVDSGAALIQDLKDNPYTVIVHVSGPPDAAYQVNQWVPVLEKLPFRIAIVARETRLCQAIRGGTVPVIYAREAETVSQVISAGVKVVLYPANGIHNAQVLRHSECNHVFINHGESDKVVNQSKFLLAYDYLFVGGQLAKDRLIEAKLPVRDDQVVFVGRPQAEMSLTKKTPQAPLRTVLYAPTWEGFTEVANFGSVREMGLGIVKHLLDMPDINFVFKPHPFTGSRCNRTKAELKKIKALCTKSGATILGDGDSLHGAMNQSDLLLTDVSSVLNEYLVTEKPIVLCDPSGASSQDLAKDYPSSQAAYVLHDVTELPALVTSIATQDTLSEQRKQVRTYSLGDHPDGALAEFEKQLAALLG